MAKKDERVTREAAVQVFRQFAWHLAGSIAAGRRRSSGRVRSGAGARR